jgi:hypothetical protein
MCTYKEAIIEENGHASDNELRQEGCSLDGDIQ